MRDGDLVTESVNPVVCIPVDIRPIVVLAKAFMQEYKIEEDIFSQSFGAGDIAYINPTNPDPQPSIFLCITRSLGMEDSTPELLYGCLETFKEVAFSTRD